MKILVLFNLKADCDRAQYESWVRRSGLPAARSLVSVSDARLHRATGELNGGPCPYEFIAIVDVSGDRDGLVRDARTETVKRLRAELARFADEPLVLVTELVPEVAGTPAATPVGTPAG